MLIITHEEYRNRLKLHNELNVLRTSRIFLSFQKISILIGLLQMLKMQFCNSIERYCKHSIGRKGKFSKTAVNINIYHPKL